MMDGAYVGSIDAVREFRAALITFAEEACEAISSYEMEVRRTLDWLLETQPQYWKHQVRNCEDRVTEAKIELERRRNSKLPGGEPPSCMEERKALERARAKRQYAEDKVESTRKWGYAAQREEAEYSGRANQLSGMFDADLPKAIHTLDRVLTTLESYIALNDPPAGSSLANRGAPATRTQSIRPPASGSVAPQPGMELSHDSTIEESVTPPRAEP